MFQRSAVLRRAFLRHSTTTTTSSSRRAAAASTTTIRSLSSSEPSPPQFASKTEQWQHEGILDERGLVNFDTLHNMQVRSCRVFSEKNLFSTYSEESQNFEWMTFKECTLLLSFSLR